MKKALQLITGYKGVSAGENALLAGISKSGLIVFGVQEAQRLTGFSRITVHNLLASLTKKGLVLKLLRNKYCLKETVLESQFAVAVNAFIPSYVSFWSALSFYGFTEQQVRVVQIASVKQFKRIELKEISVHPITVKPKNFFGYVKGNGFIIASKEKALIDSALNFKNVGGFNEFVKCLKNAWSEINKELFVEFLLKTGNKSLNSRLGFLVEELGLPLSKNLLKGIHSKCSQGYVKLNPSKTKSNKYNKKWKIIVNDSVKAEKVL